MMSPDKIADLRIIQRIELGQSKGQIVAGCGRIFALSYDSLPDLIHAVEMVNLKITGKMLMLKVVPKLYAPEALAGARIIGGGADLYDGQQGEPVQRFRIVPDQQEIGADALDHGEGRPAAMAVL